MIDIAFMLPLFLAVIARWRAPRRMHRWAGRVARLVYSRPDLPAIIVRWGGRLYLLQATRALRERIFAWLL
jgi:hypothetical protein